MKKNIGIAMIGILILVIGITIYYKMNVKEETLKQVSGVVLATSDEYVVVEDEDNVVYKFKLDDFLLEVGESVVIQYTGLLDSNKDVQDIQIRDYTKTADDDSILNDTENGIFKEYYSFAKNRLEKMTLEEKIGQLLLVRFPEKASEMVKKYGFGGYVFFGKDFKNKTKEEVQNMIEQVQKASPIPLLIAVDEEGGSVVRVSNNPKLMDSPFLSPSELYQDGGLERIKEDTVQKSLFLSTLGINLNLAPVVDVVTDPNAYMYTRALQEDTKTTAAFAKTVITASKGGSVSYTLKHFPGYGNNADTHTSSITDSRTYESIVNNDLPPFQEGIKAGAESVLVSHTVVANIDSSSPASLSIPIHNILRKDLKFTGVIMTDELSMQAIDGIDNIYVKAIEAGNDLLIVTDYETAIQEIKTALENKSLSKEVINDRVLRILAWKYYKGMLYENQK